MNQQAPGDAHAHDESGERAFVPLQVAVLAVSDTRSLAEDRSGDLIQSRLEEAGHRCLERKVVRDETDAVREQILEWCGRDELRVILVTGGTGVTRRDVTPEALEELFEKSIPGFGELFRMLSYEEIGSSTIQSRATAGLVRGRLVFGMPGSTAACRLAMDRIILPQIDNRTKPCSFVGLLDKV